MKAKVQRGSGFRGLLDYAMQESKNHEIITTNMSGATPKELAAEFKISRKLRTNAKKPVVGFSLSLPVGEDMSKEKWATVIKDFLKEMEISTETNQFVAVKHNDTDKKHVHIIASRIGLDAKIWHGKFEAFKAIEATQKLEIKHGLTITPGLLSGDSSKKTITKNEAEKALRTGAAPVRILLQNIVSEAAKNKPNVISFIEKLEAAGVEVNANIASTGKLNGFSFMLDNIAFKGSDLGKDFTLKGLLKQGLTYDQNAESGELIERKERRNAEQNERENTNRSADTAANSRPGGESVNIIAGEQVDSSNISQSTNRNNEDSTAHNNNSSKNSEQERGSIVENSGELGKREQEKQAGSSADSQLIRLSNWRDTNNNIADIAAPAAASFAKNSDNNITKALKAKQEAWERQASALDSPAYRITLTGRKDGLRTYNQGKQKDGSERFYTQAEVAALLPALSRQNARGYDIYITPIDKNHHYLVVDDMTEQTKNSLLADGYKPCLLQQSSVDNIQAILKIGKQQGEQSQANTVVSELNKAYGDPKFSGVVHPFRLAGFSNKKAGRDNSFTKIMEIRQTHCSLSAARLSEVKELAKKSEKQEIAKYDRERRIVAASSKSFVVTDANSAFEKAYAKNKGLAIKNSWEIDSSRLDWSTVTQMLIDGWRSEAVKLALKQCSPNIDERHKDIEDYANRTVDKALLLPKVQAAQKAKAEEEKEKAQEPQKVVQNDKFGSSEFSR